MNRRVKLKWLVSNSNAGEVIDKSHWGDGEELLYTCARDVLRSDFSDFPRWKRTTIDDLLLTRNGTPYIHIPVENAIYSNVVQRVSVPGLDRCYLRYALEDRVRTFRGYGVSIESLNYEMWSNLEVSLPDLATQRQIADFLDRETARIDLLIEKKQKLVALLGEKWEVTVEEQLRKVDSAHIHRLKFAIHRIEQGWSPQCEDAPVEGEKWGVLKLGAVTTGTYLEEQHKALPETIEPIPSLRVKVGDVLVARASGSPRLVGKAVFVENAKLNLMLSDKHFRLVPNPKKVLSAYLATVVNSGKSRSQIEDRLSSAEGMARNIGQNVIYGLLCPFPPLEIQEKILTALRLSRENSNTIVSKTNASVDRLKEYRSALITAAVTGQIDLKIHTRSGATYRRLDAIQEEMGA